MLDPKDWLADFYRKMAEARAALAADHTDSCSTGKHSMKPETEDLLRCPHCGATYTRGSKFISEPGPELMNLPRGGRIKPNAK